MNDAICKIPMWKTCEVSSDLSLVQLGKMRRAERQEFRFIDAELLYCNKGVQVLYSINTSKRISINAVFPSSRFSRSC